MDGVLEMTAGQSPISIKTSIRDELQLIKGRNSYSELISSLITIYRIMSVDHQELMSCIVTKGAQTIFLAGFLYRRLCSSSLDFMISSMNLVEDPTMETITQLAIIMVKLVESKEEFQKYIHLAKELERDIFSQDFERIKMMRLIRDLFEAGITFEI